ncbi:MAG: periplasmic heavy metal sensor [Verrucomicrobia bacterium]|nr:MAG: periplasmic heavy metal sensor [Verrucomicrobiota bacterium]
MKRPLTTLLGALLICGGLFAAAYFVSRQVCAGCCQNAKDDLAWLRQEFHLSDGEMARVRTLHEGYLPKCAEMCEEIAAKKRELQTALTGSTNVTAEATRMISELAALRAQCQTQMLEHFAEVSRAMPAEQGKRYLAEMQRLTLGTHEQIEQSMSDSADHAHGEH